MPQSKPSIFDKSALMDRIEGDEELLKIILDVFMRNTPMELKALQLALHDGDAPAVALTGHSVKGACLNIGAEALGQLACEIETAAKQDRLGQVALMIPEFERAFAALQATISESFSAVSEPGDKGCLG